MHVRHPCSLLSELQRTPHTCASLTAGRVLQGPHHYLGGRFVPPEIRDRFSLRLPEYPGTAMCVKLATAAEPAREVHAMRNNVQDAAVLLGAEAAAKARPLPENFVQGGHFSFLVTSHAVRVHSRLDAAVHCVGRGVRVMRDTVGPCIINKQTAHCWLSTEQI